MIKSFELSNFGPVEYICANELGNINLLIGNNSAGKTYILKALYGSIRAYEEYNKGSNNIELKESLKNKLYWTFQPEKIGDLVTRGQDKLSLSINFSEAKLKFSYGPDTSKQINNIETEIYSKRETNSVFLPPKEVISISSIIFQAERDKIFGFDATYTDLIFALREPTKKGRNYPEFANSRQDLANMFEGKIEFDSQKDEWIYRKNNKKYSINLTAEGIKKIAILDTLLGNRFLTKDSIIFIDEPESNLHPTALNKFLDILFLLSQTGIQVFMTTHSYFVIKKMYLLAKSRNDSIPVFIHQRNTEESTNSKWLQHDLKDGMPENEIINESIRIFEQELALSLGE